MDQNRQERLIALYHEKTASRVEQMTRALNALKKGKDTRPAGKKIVDLINSKEPAFEASIRSKQKAMTGRLFGNRQKTAARWAGKLIEGGGMVAKRVKKPKHYVPTRGVNPEDVGKAWADKMSRSTDYSTHREGVDKLKRIAANEKKLYGWRNKTAGLPAALRDNRGFKDPEVSNYVRGKEYKHGMGRHAAYHFSKKDFGRGSSYVEKGRRTKRNLMGLKDSKGDLVERTNYSPNRKDRRTKKLRLQDQALDTRERQVVRRMRENERRSEKAYKARKAVRAKEIANRIKAERAAGAKKSSIGAGVRKAFSKLLRKATKTG